jgi:hypothetical protein
MGFQDKRHFFDENGRKLPKIVITTLIPGLHSSFMEDLSLIDFFTFYFLNGYVKVLMVKMKIMSSFPL